MKAADKWILLVFGLGFFGIVLVGRLEVGGFGMDFWITPDQQGRLLLEAGETAQAAERFDDPFWQGVSLFRSGRFEDAAGVFGYLSSREAAYNRGNALMLLGRYDEAIAAYDRSLADRPDWEDALINREIALARKEMLAPPGDDFGGTGGMLEADEIVFNDRPGQPGGEDVSDNGAAGDTMSDQEVRAMWLRRVQTEPADFLRVKFAAQLARGGSEEGGAEP